MDLMKLGAQLMLSKLGGGGSLGSVTSVLGGLLSGSDGKPDLLGMVSSMKEKGLGSIADSWLGDGDNDEISTDQVRELVGNEKVAAMASELDTDEGSILDSLKEALPQIMDKSSRGGSFLDNLGGLGGAFNMAKKLFG